MRNASSRGIRGFRISAGFFGSLLVIASVIAVFVSAWAEDSPSSEGEKLTVLTWNLRDCAVRDPSTGQPVLLHDAIAQQLAFLETDIALFQEIQADSHKGGDVEQLRDALARKGWAMPYVAYLDAKGEDDLAIFSRYPLDSSSPVTEPSDGDPWPRPGLMAVVSTPSGPLELYNFHFKAMSDAISRETRKKQAKALVEVIRRRHAAGWSDTALIIAGDLNTTEELDDLQGADSTLGIITSMGSAETDDDLIALNLDRLPDTPTFEDSRYSSLLDHLIVSRRLSALGDGLKIEVVLAEKAPVPVSDHRAVLVRIPPWDT